MAEPRRGEDWQQRRDRAQQAWLAAVASLAAQPEAAVPQPVRDAVTALGGLLGIWHGYGEDDDGG